MAKFEGYIGALGNVQLHCDQYMKLCAEGQAEAKAKAATQDQSGLSGSFSAFIPLLIQVEGGYQNHPADAGNYNSLGQNVGTNHGISARFLEDIIKRPPTVSDIKNLTRQEAIALYKVHFWDKIRASEIKSQAIANTVVDHHVNSGRGVQLAQQVLNKNFGKNLKVDNGMGPLTLAAINSVSENNFVPTYNQARADYYATLSNSSSFLTGWLKRLESFAVTHKGKILGFNTIVAAALFFFLLYKLSDDGTDNRQLKTA